MEVRKISLIELFFSFLKLGMFTLGGGYAMIPLIRNEAIKKSWLSAEELDDLMAIAMAAPGVLTANFALLLGLKLRHKKGAFISALGAILPSFVIILIIAALFATYGDNSTVKSIFQALRPVVIALILDPMIRMARSSNKSLWAWLLSFTALFLVCFLGISAMYILLTVLICSFSFAYYREKIKK